MQHYMPLSVCSQVHCLGSLSRHVDLKRVQVSVERGQPMTMTDVRPNMSSNGRPRLNKATPTRPKSRPMDVRTHSTRTRHCCDIQGHKEQIFCLTSTKLIQHIISGYANLYDAPLVGSPQNRPDPARLVRSCHTLSVIVVESHSAVFVRLWIL